mgnify:CR=1 FL=1
MIKNGLSLVKFILDNTLFYKILFKFILDNTLFYKILNLKIYYYILYNNICLTNYFILFILLYFYY